MEVKVCIKVKQYNQNSVYILFMHHQLDKSLVLIRNLEVKTKNNSFIIFHCFDFGLRT